MIDIVIWVSVIILAWSLASAFVIMFALMSNRPDETLEEANARLMKMRKEYYCGKQDDA